jgi:ADP-ribose pyrophosphatase YjhB (NUDIX family)
MPDHRSGCIALNGEGEVLVVHNRESKQWQLPAALVKDGEDAEEAAIRGLQEKMSITVRPERLLGSRPGAELNISQDTWFLAHIGNQEPALQDGEAYDKWGFFSLVDLTQRYEELSPTLKNFLEAMAYDEIDLAV